MTYTLRGEPVNPVDRLATEYPDLLPTLEMAQQMAEDQEGGVRIQYRPDGKVGIIVDPTITGVVEEDLR